MTWINPVRSGSSLTPWLLLAAALVAQWQFGADHQQATLLQTRAAPAPSASSMTFASLGETRAAATAAVLYAQSFDAQAGKAVSLRSLDMAALGKWLRLAGDLNPTSQYPTFLASRLYADFASPTEARRLLLWIRDQFEREPSVHWPSLTHAVYLARYRLKDLALARQLASALRTVAPAVQIPPWARQMEVFMLREADELGDAKALLGGLIESGQVKDEKALAVMLSDLKEIERRLSQDQRPPIGGRSADKQSEAQLNRQTGLATKLSTVE